jgi:hypothetical protein
MLALLAAILSAQPGSSLPPGVTALFPPTAAEAAASPAEKVLILARWSEGGMEKCSGIWELDPSDPPRITLRVRFEDSSWSPNTLVHSFPKPPVFADVIRQQADGDRSYRVNLFRINYRDWSVKSIYRGKQALDVISTSSSVYMDIGSDGKPEDLRVLRAGFDELESPKEPFRFIRRVDSSPHLRLVRRSGAPKDQYAFFDTTRDRIVASITLPTSDPYELAVDESLTRVAWRNLYELEGAIRHDRIGMPQFCKNVVHVAALDGSSHATFPIGVYFFAGSGTDGMSSADLLFTNDGRLLYSSVPTPDPMPAPPPPLKPGESPFWTGNTETVKPDRLSYVFATGASEPARTTDPVSPPFSSWGDDLPENLKPFARARPDENELAHAFLKSKGIDYDIPAAVTWTTLGASADGHRIAVKLRESRRDAVFMLGDLQSNTLREVPAPKELVDAIDISLVWVSVPPVR